MGDSYAVIGLGSIASRHRKNIKEIFPKARIIAMSASGRKPVEKLHNVDYVASDLEDVLMENPQWVVIASPATLHSEHAKFFLNHKIPVLIEKPLTAKLVDAEALVEMAYASDVPVSIAYCLRYMPASQIVKDNIEAGTIGTLYNVMASVGQYLPSWRDVDFRQSVSSRASLGGGVLLELSHEIDYLQWILGAMEVEFCLLRNSRQLNLEVEELADVVLTSKQSGTVCNIHLDFLQNPAQRMCQFIGSSGRIEWNLVNNTVTLHTSESVTMLHQEPTWDRNQMYISMLRDFDAYVAGLPNSCVRIAEAAQTIGIIENAKLKAVWGANV